MAKDPAFLFYPNDWIGGTMGMTFEEKGVYIDLLMMQFNRGHMEGHMIGQVAGQLWDKVKDKFIQDEKGLWFNVRLEVEQNNRKTFTASRRNNLNGTNQHTKKEGHIKGHMTSHMEDEDKDENSSNVYLEYLEKNHFSKFETMKMKLGSVNVIEFLEFFNNKCVLESQPFDFNKLNARFGILFSNWNKDKPKDDKSGHEAPDLDDFRQWRG